MDHVWEVSGNLRQGEHREKSEIYLNLPIVDTQDGPHTIRYVSMVWSRLCALPWRRASPLLLEEAWR
jgi:hypothetical protein